jgi:hypothetical protein
MKKTIVPFKKQLKQFKKLIANLSYDSSEKASREIKRLFAQLSFNIPSVYIKSTLVGSTLAIALLSGYNVSAQQFKAPVKNPYGITDNDNVFQPEFMDIDGDGDYDLMTASYYGDHKVYRNIGTKFVPNFDAPTTNPYGLSGSGLQFTLLTSGDIDGDGDVDIFETGFDYYSMGSVDFKFIENTGTATAPAFTGSVNNPFGLTAIASFISMPKLVDIDGDGDLDIIASSFNTTSYSTEYLLYLNAGTASLPSFEPPITNPYNMTVEAPLSFPTFGDLDRDGDLDLYNFDYYGNLTMYRDTSGTTGDPMFTSNGITSPHNIVFSDESVRTGTFIDIDGDNDLDFFASAMPDTTTNAGGLWFFKDTANYLGLPAYQKEELAFSMYPSPATNEINVECTLVADNKTTLVITDAQGRQVYNTELVDSKNNIKLDKLATGIYTIQIENDKYKGTKKFIKQ